VLLHMQQAPRCGAKTRKGSPCQSPAMPNGRCRVHGGPSPGSAYPGNRRSVSYSPATMVDPAASTADASSQARTADIQIAADAAQKSGFRGGCGCIRVEEAKVELV
jgi:hypothetical protein